jgi:hypothetical protein
MHESANSGRIAKRARVGIQPAIRSGISHDRWRDTVERTRPRLAGVIPMSTKKTQKSGKTMKDLSPKQTVKGGRVRFQDFHF